MPPFSVGLFSALACFLVVAVPLAAAQESYPASVTNVVDGDTVDAQVVGGPALEVQLIGIDAPELGDCGGEQATGYLEQLALGRNVTLVSDPTLEQFESPGSRPLFYVDRDDGRDLGLEMVRAGWADIWFLSDFQRSSAYLDAEADAEVHRAGVWKRCGGDFHFSRADELRERRFSAVDFMRRYYRRVSNRQFATAWGMLTRRVRLDLGPFAIWRAGHRRSLGVSVLSARARLSGRRAVVSVHLRSRDRDACSGRIVRQYFRGRWILAPRRSSWVAVRVRIRKTGGGRPRLTQSECRPAPTPPSPPDRPNPGPPSGCHPSYTPCVPSNRGDLDCADINGPVQVIGPDEYGLDGNDDGVGCE